MLKKLFSAALIAVLSSVSATGQQIDARTADRIDALFSQFTESTPGAAVAVVLNGDIIYSTGFGMADLEHGLPVTPTTVFDIASISKQFAGMAIATLIEDGTVDLDAEVRSYLPELPDFGYSLTVRHLVHHISGIRDWPATLSLAGWRFDDVISFDQILRMAWAQKELNFEPGTEYSYSNTGYNLLAEIVFRVSGQSFREWTAEHIFEPLDMGDSHFQDDHTELVPGRAFGYDPSVDGFRSTHDGLTAYGSSSLFSTVDDMARWLINFDSHDVGGTAVIERMRTRGVLSNGEQIAYAYGISAGTYRGLQTWSHSGSWAGFRTQLVHFPEQRFGVIILSNQGNYTPGPSAFQVANIFLSDEFTDETAAPATEHSEVRIDATLLSDYEGTFKLGAGWYVTITNETSGMMVQATNEAKFKMTPVSDTEFWVEAYGASIHFQRDADGEVSTIGYKGITAPRVEPFDADRVDLSEYEGLYASDELDTNYQIEVQDGSLTAYNQRHGEVTLTASQEDEFIGSSWFFSPVKFVRGDTGRVTGMLIGKGRARNLRFRRVSDDSWTDGLPEFEFSQGFLFQDGRTLTNAVADFDNDGDLDLFVGFNGRPNRMYRNDGGTFTDVAAQVGLADNDVTRTAAWGDYDNDGHIDLFVGFVSRQGSSNRLYRNEGNGRSFSDVTDASGIALTGSFRQANWVDYDRDGDVDLFIGLRDKPNVLFRNDNGRFTDVASSLGMADPRRTVGAAWFDFDRDGDLDLIVANMDGDANGLFRNDGNSFVDVAEAAGISDGGRALGDQSNGTVRPTIVDYDSDGNLDVFMANYGPNGLFRNTGGGTFENVAPALGLAIDNRYDTSTWGDFDNDGDVDVYINGTITGGKSYHDYLYRNDGDRFTDVTPWNLLNQQADHGAHWADFDLDGDLDLALTGAAETGMHHIMRNALISELANRSLQVLVLDANGHYTLAGAEVRLFDSATGGLLGLEMLDTGSGYNSQNAMPVHFGLPQNKPVDVEVTTMTPEGRKSARLEGISPGDYVGQWLVLRVDGITVSRK